MIFYLGLFLFIISLILGLALMIAGKGMKREKFLLLASIHLIFLLGFIASLLLKKNNTATSYNYFFTVFICSGLILSGLAWRSLAPMILRYYFSIFALTIPVFLVTPSLLLNFLMTTNFSSTNGPSFHLDDKYFLETQSNSTKQDNNPRYKVIIKRGMFHQTIQRDIEFGGVLDSIRVLEIEKGKSMLVRGYTNKTTYVSSDVDSSDVNVLLKIVKQGELEYHL